MLVSRSPPALAPRVGRRSRATLFVGDDRANFALNLSIADARVGAHLCGEDHNLGIAAFLSPFTPPHFYNLFFLFHAPPHHFSLFHLTRTAPSSTQPHQ